MDLRLAIVLVLALVASAGCAELAERGERFADTLDEDGATPTGATGPTVTEPPTATAVPVGTSVSADNPWGQSVVPVRVNDTVRDGRNATALVASSVAFWNRNIERYTDWEYRFKMASDPSNARVEVRFSESVRDCNGEVHVAGCASLLTEGRTARDLEVARVKLNGSNANVQHITRHEFGHLLGLRHDDEPDVYMANGSVGPVADADTRPNPFLVRNVDVAVDVESLRGYDSTVRKQVRHAVEYYDDGAAGTVPLNVSFGRTDHHEAAEVLVTNDPADGCSGESGARYVTTGRQGDADQAIETHTRVVMCIDVEDDALAWYVGRGLAPAMGLDSSEWAEPFESQSYEYRRSEWWK